MATDNGRTMSERRSETESVTEQRPALRSSRVTRHADGVVTYFDGETVRELRGIERLIAIAAHCLVR
ncbi:hypothetical protein ACFQPA_17985 [Halomarina halobia]|uniref:Uncharacterized protein n=1 Tax=Halomarina halobia TaxID=3033386 RepID=A0ABD6ADI2_9EURY|nr:hypothetical protein [Halomarina sp. PSR21]